MEKQHYRIVVDAKPIEGEYLEIFYKEGWELITIVFIGTFRTAQWKHYFRWIGD